MLKNFLLVFLGGGLGSLIRYIISKIDFFNAPPIINTIIIIFSYKKDLNFLKNTYKGVRWVLVGFIIFFLMLIFLKSVVNA